MQSAIIEDRPQRDSRRVITERHTFDDGTYEDVCYLAEPNARVADMLTIRSAQIQTRLAEQQAEQEANAVAEKERAAVLLKMPDEDLRKLLMLKDGERVEDAKAVLVKASEFEAVAVEEVAVKIG